MATKTPKTIAAAPATMAPEHGAEEVSTIAGFLQGLAPFFQRAGDLERRAKDALSLAKTWPKPASLDDDMALVEQVRDVNATLKELEAHWAARNVFHAFHRKLVAAMQRAENPLKEAAAIGNGLHNRYVSEEQARVRAEEDRLRREEQEREQRRQRDLADQLERDALAAEAGSPDLSDRERQFVEAYAWSNNAAHAAEGAGYKDAERRAAILLGTPKIVAALEALRKARDLRRQAEAVKTQPVAVETPKVVAQVATKGVTTVRAEVVDEDAFIRAALSGAHGIPAACLTVNQVKLNELARALGERVELWPGVRLVKSTTIRG